MLTWREFWSYVQLLRRWSLVIIFATLLSVGTAWYLTEDSPDYYIAQASVMVGNNFTSNNLSSTSVELSNVLANYYAVLMRREVILGPVVERLGLDFSWGQIAQFMLTTNVNVNANLLEIQITDSNPERAAAIANAIADQLIAYSPNSPEKLAAERQEIERQINETQALISDIDKKIEELEAKQASLSSAIDLRDISDQIEKLKTSRSGYQSTYNNLLLLRENSTANSISIFERAQVPTTPLPQRRALVLGIAGLGAFLLGVFAVLILDYLDTRWHPNRDLEGRIGIPNLGSIHYGATPKFTTGSKELLSRQSAVRNAYTNMVLQAKSHVPRTVLVSSPRPSQPRSAFAIDLANVYAQSGLRVLLVDAELAKPYVTRMLLPDGAVSEVHEDAQNSAPIKPWVRSPNRAYNLPPDLWVRLRSTPMMNVMLLPSQNIDPDDLPILVPSLHWPELIDTLRQTADIVIFDGPSLLTGADGALLAPIMDGVVLALDPTTDSRAEINASKSRLLNSEGTRLLGAVTVGQSKAYDASTQSQTNASGSTRPARFGIKIDARGVTLNLPSRRKPIGPAPATSRLIEQGQQPAPAAPTDQDIEATASPHASVHSNGHWNGLNNDHTAQPTRIIIPAEPPSEPLVTPIFEQGSEQSAASPVAEPSPASEQVAVAPAEEPKGRKPRRHMRRMRSSGYAPDRTDEHS